MSKTIVIPELEEAALLYKPHKNTWPAEDIAVLEKYYGRVPAEKLAKYLHRGRNQIREKVIALKIVERREKGELE